MPYDFPKTFFVTGTDTDVGKTMTCAVLMAGLNAAYWKPVQSGTADGTDTEWIKKSTGLPEERFFPERWRLTRPLSPHAAAEGDGVRIDLSDFRLPVADGVSHLMVEGAGGLLVPLNERHFMIDLIRHLNLPVLLVARSGLGTINHTLLSLSQLRQYKIEIFGVVMNGPENRGNRQAIAHYGRVRVLAEIGPIETIDRFHLTEIFHQNFDVIQHLLFP